MLRSLKTALVFLVGALAGWVLLGWVLFPVRWTNADLADLSPRAQATYLLLVSDSYALDGDLAKARALVAPLDQLQAADLLAALIADRQARGATVEAQRLERLAEALQLQPAAQAVDPGVDVLSRPEGDVAPPDVAPPDVAGAGSAGYGAAGAGSAGYEQALDELDRLNVDGTRLAVACGAGTGVLFFLTLLAAVGIIRRRKKRSTPVQPDYYYPPPPATPGRARAKGRNHFGTTYNLGDDGYDASFTLEGSQGEFLGECGVSQSEILDSGMPAKISAFEVWLFDQREVRTVTKVLISPHAYQDAALRSKLAPKGEALLAEVGRVVVLETSRLRCEAEITLAQFADHDTARDAYFSRLTVELSTAILDPYA